MGMQEVLMTAVVVALAATAQGAAGFGYALFATPLLLWIGLPLPGVVALVATCSALQAIAGARELRADVPWRLARVATVARIAAMVLGTLMLRRMAGLDRATVRLVVGGILVLLVAVQAAWRPVPRPALHAGWAGLAFVASGWLAGVCGMGGPPLVLWLMAHDWSARRTRGFLFAVFAMAIPVQITVLGLTFGPAALRFAALGVALAPLVYGGSRLGLAIGNRMEKERLRRVAYALLILTGLAAIIPALLQP